MAKLRRINQNGRRPVKLTPSDRATKLGTKAFSALPKNKQWVLTWRRAHQFGGHLPLRQYARLSKKKPSSVLNQKQLNHYINLQSSSMKTGMPFFSGKKRK